MYDVCEWRCEARGEGEMRRWMGFLISSPSDVRLLGWVVGWYFVEGKEGEGESVLDWMEEGLGSFRILCIG